MLTRKAKNLLNGMAEFALMSSADGITHVSFTNTEFGFLANIVRDNQNDILSELDYVLYQSVQGLIKCIG